MHKLANLSVPDERVGVVRVKQKSSVLGVIMGKESEKELPPFEVRALPAEEILGKGFE